MFFAVVSSFDEGADATSPLVGTRWMRGLVIFFLMLTRKLLGECGAREARYTCPSYRTGWPSLVWDFRH